MKQKIEDMEKDQGKTEESGAEIAREKEESASKHAAAIAQLKQSHEASLDKQDQQISGLQKENSHLRVQLLQKDATIADLKGSNERLDERLKRIQLQNKQIIQDKERLHTDNVQLRTESTRVK